MEISASASSILGGVMLRHPFLAVKNDIFIREPVAACAAAAVGTSEKVLKIAGFPEMTAANCATFGKTARTAWNEHTDVEIDLSETTFIDCAGLGALIAVRNLTRRHNGVARLMNPTPSVQQLLDLTRTGQLFEIVNTRETGPCQPACFQRKAGRGNPPRSTP
jgi:anti-anti-sigma factor